MNKKFPTLYKLSSKGKPQFWEISASIHGAGFGRISITHGQLGTENPEHTEDIIEEGKNVGKKNETTPFEQACLEAEAKWTKAKKKGYVESLEAAQAGEVDEVIEGGIFPMLAQKFRDHAKKVVYPCAVQRKYDGIRCIAIIKNGKCTLWSRTRKPIKSVPHIVAELERIFKNKDIVVDGELYSHRFKENFEHIVHIVNQKKEPDPNHTDVEYHIYDVINDLDFYNENNLKPYRLHEVVNLVFAKPKYIIPVETFFVQDEEELMEKFSEFVADKYEGLMVRNFKGKYESNKRSYNLQKVKPFDDAEFKIIGIKEGRGKLAGHAIFICQTEDGGEFDAKMKGPTSKLKEYFENQEKYIGKMLTVRFMGYTNKNNVPRHGVATAIRDYE